MTAIWYSPESGHLNSQVPVQGQDLHLSWNVVRPRNVLGGFSW